MTPVAAARAGRRGEIASTTRGAARSIKLARVGRAIGIALLAGFALSQAIALAQTQGFGYGIDYQLYMERAQSWLDGTGFYLPEQLTGPYPVTHGVVTYPPVALVLFAPFTFVPAALWWIVPLAITAAALWRLRPSGAALWILAVVAVYPRTWSVVLLGNPSIWAFAFLAAGLVWHWPAVFVPFKVTLAPFAIVGSQRRSWWLAAAAFGLLCVPFGAMWIDYVVAMRNAQPTPAFGLAYVFGEWPIAIGLIAAGWISESQTNRATTAAVAE